MDGIYSSIHIIKRVTNYSNWFLFDKRIWYKEKIAELKNRETIMHKLNRKHKTMEDPIQ